MSITHITHTHITHKPVRIGGGSRYVPDMGGATTGYTEYAWPTLPHARRGSVVTGTGGIHFPLSGLWHNWDGLHDFGCAGCLMDWAMSQDTCLEFRRYLEGDDGKWYIPVGHRDILEFPDEASCRAWWGGNP